MTHYNTTRNGITSWKEFKGRPSTIDWLRSIPAMVLIFLIGAIGHKRKKPKQIKPMGTHLAYVPPSYKCKSATPIDPSKISERIKSYSVGTPAKDIHEFHSNLLTQLYGNKLTA